MKSGFVFIQFLLLFVLAGNRQLFGQEQKPTRLLRLYEDDDYINIRGRGTDEAYTNGSRIDLFYTKDHNSNFFLDKPLLRAGDSSVDVYGWSIMQVMYTPRKIDNKGFQPDDYPWSGGLFITHSLYSYNPRKKYDVQTEIVAGVLGPSSLAEQLQKGFHRLIHYQQPMGWGHQFRNDLLLNFNIAAEKQLFGLGPRSGDGVSMELIGGSRISGGTMENKASVYSLIRIGKMVPYFEGYLAQYSSAQTPGSKRKNHLQAYFIVRPQVTMAFTNALLEGGVFSSRPPVGLDPNPAASTATPGSKDLPPATDPSIKKDTYHGLREFVYTVDYGVVLALRSFSISFTQSWSSAQMKGLYNHEVGNISLYFIL